MRKAVAYYRSRPSEPEASDLALRLQHEAVRNEIEKSGLALIGEFTEREGESGTEGCPAYVAAARMAHGQGELVEFIIASRAAIGSGEPFKEPDIKFEPPDDQDIFGQGFITCELLTPSVERASEITLPNGAPGPLCLYADFRPRQLDTLVYLCNATPETLLDVVIATECISMYAFFHSQTDEYWEEASRTSEKRWAAVPPGTCVQVAWLNHVIWDDVRRYRLTYADAAGRRWTAEAHDGSLTPYWLAQDPGMAWVVFSEADETDHAAPGTRPKEAP